MKFRFVFTGSLLLRGFKTPGIQNEVLEVKTKFYRFFWFFAKLFYQRSKIQQKV